MPALPGDLFEAQEELLDAAVAALDYLETVGLLGAPTRRGVVPPGELVIDCDQVVVLAGPVGEIPTRPTNTAAAGGTKHRVYGRLTGVTLNVAVSRCCIPIGKTNGATYTPPTMAELQAASEQINADGWALWNGIFTRLVAEDFEFLTKCNSITWETMTPLGPRGACAGWLVTLRAQLPGYMEPLGSGS